MTTYVLIFYTLTTTSWGPMLSTRHMEFPTLTKCEAAAVAHGAQAWACILKEQI
jgi:hypothetical protein